MVRINFICACVSFWMIIETDLFEFTWLTPLGLRLWVWMDCDVYKRKVDTRDELLARILDAAARIKKNMKINSDGNHVIFAHELQRALNLTLVFSERLLWIVTNFLFEHKIKIERKLTVSNFSFFINIDSVFAFVNSNISTSLTNQN